MLYRRNLVGHCTNEVSLRNSKPGFHNFRVLLSKARQVRKSDPGKAERLARLAERRAKDGMSFLLLNKFQSPLVMLAMVLAYANVV